MIGKPLSMKCLMAFLLLLNCTVLFAQERVVTGKIKDPSGNPLPGVNVNVFGTRISVTADVTGTFRIPVSSENSVLVFSFVGFLQKEQKVGSDSAFNILMTYDNADLDQVVVVGYGTSKRRDLTGSVYSVKPGMVTATPVSNAAEALQGRIPGLDINRNSGVPGGGVSIQLRGNRTLNGTGKGGQSGVSSEPLVIIDGFQGGNLSDLNPNDIESIEVMKDASSTAIYGWQGANGVILVTTKRGKDRPRVSYSGFYGVNTFAKYPKVRMGQDFLDFRKEAFRGRDTTKTLADYTNESVLDPTTELHWYKDNKWVDWLDLLTQTGITQSHTVSIQSGGDRSKIYFGTGVYKEEGMLPGTNSTRYNARLNFDQKISNVFKAGFNTQLTYQNSNNRKDPYAQASVVSLFGEPYDSLGNVKLFPQLAAGVADPKNKNYLSPITDTRPGASQDNTKRGNLITNAYLEITPITGLSLRSNLGITLGYTRRGQFYDSLTLQNYNQPNNLNTAEVRNETTVFYNWDNIITYTRRFNDHNITLTGISSVTSSQGEWTNILAPKIILNGFGFNGLENSTAKDKYIPTTEFTKTTTSSYAGRLNYTFKGKYLLTGTIRADGVSRLASGHKWDYFPSVGLGWNIHQEDFMKDAYIVNNLKLRATYGVAGNASIAPYGTQMLIATTPGVIGNTTTTTGPFSTIAGNESLGWEKTATVNIGLDFALLKSRLYGTIDAYKATTDHILFRRPLPISSGFTEQWQNLGSSENKGIELALSSVNVNRGSFRWTTTLTFTKATEKLTHLITDKDIPVKEDNSLLNGHPVKSWWGYKKVGIWQTGENKENVHIGSYVFQPGDIKVEDRNHDGEIDAVNDRGFVGADVPKWFGGLQNTFSYKGIELSVYLVARYGQIINADWIATHFNVNGQGNGYADFQYWTPEHQTNDFPRPRSGATYNDPSYTGYLGMNFIDGSFFKVKTATLAYTLPAQWTRKVYSDKVRLYVTGNNILTVTKNKILKSYDPERGGSENSPLTRQFVFGANIDF